jgi:hypothetical protein
VQNILQLRARSGNRAALPCDGTRGRAILRMAKQMSGWTEGRCRAIALENWSQMSRAFVKEDADEPERQYGLPDPADPGFDAAAAWALLEGARAGETSYAEAATGYRWGDPHLYKHVRRILEREQERAESDRDTRLIQVARRFLKALERS